MRGSFTVPSRLLMQISLGVMSAFVWLGGSALRLHGESLTNIQQRGTLRIGVKHNLPLMGQVDAQGKLTGFEIELAHAIASLIWGEGRLDLVYVPLLNQQRLSAIADGSVDLVIANLRITESRQRVVAFSHPYLVSNTSFVSRNEPTRSNIKNGVIGVLQGSVAIGRIRSRMPDANLLGLSSYGEAIQKLKNHEIDRFAGDRIILKGWQFGATLHGEGTTPSVMSSFHYAHTGLGYSQIAIALPKGLQHQNFRQAINLAIETLESSGQLQQMRNKWRLSEADAAPVVRLERSRLSTLSLMPRPKESTNVSLICSHGSIINISLFDSPIRTACSFSHLGLSTGAQNSSG